MNKNTKRKRKKLNIYERKDNRWEGRYIKYYIQNKPQYGYVYGKTYAEAKDKLTNIKHNTDTENDIITDSNVTLYDMADEWLKSIKIKVKQSSYIKYYYTVKNHIKDSRISNYTMNNLKPLVITDYTNETINKGKLSMNTIRYNLLVLGMILKYYKGNYDKGFDINIIYPKEEKKPIEILTDNEIMALEKYLINDVTPEKIGILLALYTGLRLGELCALTLDDINLQDGYVSITKTLQRVKDFENIDGAKTKLIIETPKSETSIRQIPLPDFILPLLQAFYNKCYVEGKKIYLLTGAEKAIDPRTYQNHFKKYLKDCSIKSKNFHVLRHTFATRCINSGCDIKSVSEMLGHSSIKITLELYVHPDFESKKANINKVLPLAVIAINEELPIAI